MNEINITLSTKTKKPALWTGKKGDAAIAVLDHHSDPKRPIFLGRNNHVLIPLHKGDYIMVYDNMSGAVTYQIRGFCGDTALCRTLSDDTAVPDKAREVLEEMRQSDFVPPFDRSTTWYEHVVNKTHNAVMAQR